MNRYFEDSRYYLGRAVRTATKGVRTELEPVVRRISEMAGREEEPEPDRMERLQRRAKKVEAKAEAEARKTMADVRERVRTYRQQA